LDFQQTLKENIRKERFPGRTLSTYLEENVERGRRFRRRKFSYVKVVRRKSTFTCDRKRKEHKETSKVI
jgi:hypothetical protein